MTDTIEGEIVDAEVTHGGELVPIAQSPGALNLFGATPAAAIENITETARVLTDVLRQQHLYTSIQGKNHVTVEGWTLLGSLLGVFPVVVSTERVTEPADGYKARVEARTLDGRIVGAGEALCTRAEKMWSKRDEFALMAMAQTRATSRALRNPLGFVVKMAGYETAGAEEMPNDTPTPTPTPPANYETIADYDDSLEGLRSDVRALLMVKEGKTSEEAVAIVAGHASERRWLERAKHQLEKKPDRSAA